MARNEQLWEWARNEGIVRDASGNLSMPETAIPDGLVYDCENVDFGEAGLVIPRTGIAEFPQSGTPPSQGIQYLFAQTTASTNYLWAFQSSGSAATNIRRYDGSSWSVVTPADTLANLAQPHCVQYNGKVFMAYDSDVNRLHVYDGTAIRRVGVVASAAATVADTGSGSYAATIRYYKIQFRILSGSTVVAASELSPSVTFTPSGTGSAARITRPSIPDSATHWAFYVSADGLTYQEASSAGNIAVGTGTYDDVFNPTAYIGYTLAPVPGLNVPPPSCKYLATDGTRLVMAGAWESSAAAGQTTPKTNRVWFTRPLGATDIGDDESVTSTTDSRYWIDIDDPRGSGITALHQIGGVVYVFFREAVWRLLATGSSDTPYRAEQVSTSAGAVSQYATVVGQMPGTTEDAIYFVSASGFYRISSYGALEWLGRDVVPRNYSAYLSGVTLAYDSLHRDVWMFINAETAGRFLINVDRLVMRGSEYHGGARRFTTADTDLEFTNGTVYNSEMVLAGGTGSTPLLYRVTSGGLGVTDVITMTCSATSPTIMVPGHKITVEGPILQVTNQYFTGATLTVTLEDPYSYPVNTRAVTFTTPTTGAGVVRAPIAMADANAVRITISTAHPAVGGAVIERAWVPYRQQEPV